MASPKRSGQPSRNPSPGDPMWRTRIVVDFAVDTDQSHMQSTHYAASDSDAATLDGKPFGGQAEVAAAMLREAVRREALLAVGMIEPVDPERFQALLNADPKTTEMMAISIRDLLMQMVDAELSSAIQQAAQAVSRVSQAG